MLGAGPSGRHVHARSRSPGDPRELRGRGASARPRHARPSLHPLTNAHAQVRPSPEATKRSFLQRKGLTADEIDAAFSRVPAPEPALVPPAAAPAYTPAPAQGVPAAAGHLVPYAGQQSGAAAGYSPQQQAQPYGAPQQYAYSAGPPAQLQPLPPQQEPIRWTQVRGRACGDASSHARPCHARPCRLQPHASHAQRACVLPRPWPHCLCPAPLARLSVPCFRFLIGPLHWPSAQP